MLREIDDLQSQKDAADARISALERDLQQSLLETERMKSAENREVSRLRAQLTEEVTDKKRQAEALEDALREIQRLKETVKTERRSEESDEAAREEEEEEDVGTCRCWNEKNILCTDSRFRNKHCSVDRYLVNGATSGANFLPLTL